MRDMGNDFAEVTHSAQPPTWRGQRQRPHIRPPITLGEVVAILVTIAGLLFTLIPLALYYPSLPNTIPSHFTISGQVDAYGPKMVLWIFPAVGLFITVLFQFLCHFPWAFNFPVRITAENAARQYVRGRLLLRWVNATVWLFAIIQWQALQAARGASQGLGPSFSVIILAAALLLPMVMLTVITIWVVRGR